MALESACWQAADLLGLECSYLSLLSGSTSSAGGPKRGDNRDWKGGCPWKEHLYQLESGLSPAGTIAFVIYRPGWTVAGAVCA